MKIRRTAHFDRNYTRAPQEIQQAFDKQSLLLLQNPRHPSLRAKKYDEAKRPASPVTGVFISSSKGTPTSCKKSLATRNDRAPIPPNRDSHTRDLADLAAGLGGMIETCQRLWPRCSGSSDTGYIQNEIQNAAYEYQRAIEKGERTVVGVNRFQQRDDRAVPAFRLDPAL